MELKEIGKTNGYYITASGNVNQSRYKRPPEVVISFFGRAQYHFVFSSDNIFW